MAPFILVSIAIRFLFWKSNQIEWIGFKIFVNKRELNFIFSADNETKTKHPPPLSSLPLPPMKISSVSSSISGGIGGV
ncbi:hypothetical protein DERF_004545 [Dermatophagoides farinae]|uniref:Uncharacterized protein n=1 Tax=Dermatophagoides farinae TaxID=6954 RepID=A0A922I2L0_DERFA|nr:hypothetical protein DERF_004545 [Dermatophagoides farinae]